MSGEPRERDTEVAASIDWPRGPASPAVGARDLHVWHAQGADFGDRLGLLLAALPDEERTIAMLLSQPATATQYALRSALLRDVMGRYTDMDPQSLRIQRGPRSTEALPETDIVFHAGSHAGQAVCVVTRARAVGLGFAHPATMTQPPRDEHADEVMQTRAERARLRSLPDEERADALRYSWAVKEAFYTAGLDNWWQVPAPAHVPPSGSISLRPHPGGEAWSLALIRPVAGFVGVVVAAGDVRLSFLRWPVEPVPPLER